MRDKGQQWDFVLRVHHLYVAVNTPYTGSHHNNVEWKNKKQWTRFYLVEIAECHIKRDSFISGVIHAAVFLFLECLVITQLIGIR